MPTLETRSIRLSSVRYVGPNVGREWAFRIDAGTRVLELRRRIEPGTTATFDAIVTTTTARSAAGVPVRILAREIDTQPRYDDLGWLELPSSETLEPTTVTVPVRTRGGDDVDATELEFRFTIVRGELDVTPRVRFPRWITIDGTSFSHDVTAHETWSQLVSASPEGSPWIRQVHEHPDALDVELPDVADGLRLEIELSWTPELDPVDVPPVPEPEPRGPHLPVQRADATGTVVAIPLAVRALPCHRWRIHGLGRGGRPHTTATFEVRILDAGEVVARHRGPPVRVAPRFELLRRAGLDGGLREIDEPRVPDDRYWAPAD